MLVFLWDLMISLDVSCLCTFGADYAEDILLFVHDHILKVCEHDILQTACLNFTILTVQVQQRGTGTKMN